MKLAILHYHLNPGGVTRVIANHLLALDAAADAGAALEVLILSDGQTSGWPRETIDTLCHLDVKLVTVGGLGYDTEATVQPVLAAVELRDVLERHGCNPEMTVLHAHNHSLGKNRSLPGALRQLASEGYPLLLQIHDFAEDFRPANYRHLRESCAGTDVSECAYFQGPHVHFAVLNRRDFQTLRAASVGEERLHFLPNPVPELEDLPPREAAKAVLAKRWGVSEHERYVLSPVRGIRRKNVGELLLLSVLRDADACPPARFAITLAPQNPAAQPSYERWRSLAGELQLRCLFDTGGEGGLSFPDNLAAADHLLTTSVAEGFGMVFLESWLAGRPLVGRNLPEITADFVEAGLRLETLYDRLAVPVDWVHRHDVLHALETACREMYAHYDLPVPSRAELEAAVDQMTQGGTVDFGRLDEPLQERVIRRAHDCAIDCGKLRSLNPALAEWEDADASIISTNRQVVRDSYSVRATGGRLRAIYRSLLESPRGSFEEPADAGVILRTFLDLNRFHLICT